MFRVQGAVPTWERPKERPNRVLFSERAVWDLVRHMATCMRAKIRGMTIRPPATELIFLGHRWPIRDPCRRTSSFHQKPPGMLLNNLENIGTDNCEAETPTGNSVLGNPAVPCAGEGPSQRYQVEGPSGF